MTFKLFTSQSPVTMFMAHGRWVLQDSLQTLCANHSKASKMEGTVRLKGQQSDPVHVEPLSCRIKLIGPGSAPLCYSSRFCSRSLQKGNRRLWGFNRNPPTQTTHQCFEYFLLGRLLKWLSTQTKALNHQA